MMPTNTNSNPDSIASFIKDMERGGTPGKTLKFDPKTGKLLVTGFDSKDDYTVISADEAKMFLSASSCVIVLSDEDKKCILENPESAYFQSLDDGQLLRFSLTGPIKGTVHQSAEQKKPVANDSQLHIFLDKNNVSAHYHGNPVAVISVPGYEAIFSRIKGIYETDALRDKKVLIVGVGSGGGPIALELAKQGIQHLTLVDPDRLELGNISRHICGISDLGRYKTKAVADILRNKNPFIEVETYEVDVTEADSSFRLSLLTGVDLVICATDNRKSRLVINRLCVENDIPCIYGGAFRRAYGGQVLRVLPHKSLCYQCFISAMPQLAEDYEISNQDQVQRIAYSNSPTIPIEPGLSTDILPISTMVTKLALMELLRDKPSTLNSLFEDLNPSLYLWFNRREQDTPWMEVLSPTMVSLDQMTVLRWYGVEADKNKECPVCGTFLGIEPPEDNPFVI